MQQISNFAISSIRKGICAFVAICREDDVEDIEYIVRKLLNLRLFNNMETGRRWDKSLKDLELEILCISQFTLFSSIKGNKLDFHKSMNPTDSLKLYSGFVESLRKAYISNLDGEFGAYMNVKIENDGPVTIILDSKNRE
ncbi:unnamed protein product [Dracunculus medinensis]|uniref:D-aminoacyl-tRNA deacylase n=1 Tax=Dracunculus medinensis TaxID=318479 RepID=A0A3P7QF75_DRAME|nr:unnamed protein product [Dracunculus medinensis]